MRSEVRSYEEPTCPELASCLKSRGFRNLGTFGSPGASGQSRLIDLKEPRELDESDEPGRVIVTTVVTSTTA